MFKELINVQLTINIIIFMAIIRPRSPSPMLHKYINLAKVLAKAYISFFQCFGSNLKLLFQINLAKMVPFCASSGDVKVQT